MKTALITGATGQIGSALALQFAEEGFFVLCSGRDANRGQRIIEVTGVHRSAFFRANLTRASDRTALFATIRSSHRPLGVVICAAGIIELSNLKEQSTATIERVIATNLTATILILREAVKTMIHQKQNGILIAIGSRWQKGGPCGTSVYSATKSALVGFIRTLQKECLEHAIRVCLLSPGSVASPMSAKADAQAIDGLIEASYLAKTVSFIVSAPSNIVFDELSIKAFPYDFIRGV